MVVESGQRMRSVSDVSMPRRSRRGNDEAKYQGLHGKGQLACGKGVLVSARASQGTRSSSFGPGRHGRSNCDIASSLFFVINRGRARSTKKFPRSTRATLLVELRAFG